MSEPTIKEIISSARSAAAPCRGAVLLSLLTSTLLWASFTPLDWGPLGWICLVPLIALVRLERRTRLMYTIISLSGLAYSLATLQWMRLGHPSMYLAWFALAVYVAVYFPLFVAIARVAVHRFSIPLTIAVPVVWVGLEYLRGHLLTGFSWYYLAHTQYRWIELIQISDLVGAYGVSFLIVMTSACVVTLLPHSLFARLRLVPPLSLPDELTHLPVDGVEPQPERSRLRRQRAVTVTACVAAFCAVLMYGYLRRGQADFTVGPRVALIQGNFTSSVKHDPEQWGKMFRTHEALTGLAVKHQPDIIVWPETMFREQLLEIESDLSDKQLLTLAPPMPNFDPETWIKTWRTSAVSSKLADMSKMAGAALVIGIEAWSAGEERIHRYNSAVFVRPDLGIVGRYDKLHRVIFGEYVPLQNAFPWLARLTPFPADFGIEAGTEAAVFDYNRWRFAPIICFEDTVPHLVRRIVEPKNKDQSGVKSVDVLVNLTNDGWFHGSSELDQHLITAAFRSVECRIPMIRAVNTGISALIDPDGVIVEPDVFIDGDPLLQRDSQTPARTSLRDPKTGQFHKQLNAALIYDVALDNRRSFYVRNGDWFAGGCCCCTMFLVFSSFVPRRRRSRET